MDDVLSLPMKKKQKSEAVQPSGYSRTNGWTIHLLQCHQLINEVQVIRGRRYCSPDDHGRRQPTLSLFNLY